VVLTYATIPQLGAAVGVGDGLETRVEDTTVEEGCTGVAGDDGLGDEDDDGGEGGDEDVDFDVGVGVGVG